MLKITDKNLTFKPTFIYALGLSALVVAVYFKLFSAQFISWDDGEVLLKNKAVHQFNLKAFFTNYYVGNYAPLTMVGFAIDWLLFHGKAIGHHAISIFLHIVNAYLVYYLSRIILKDNLKALCCAVIFSLHPLQVETVAWVSAKNNILYVQFFLIALICYSKYLINKQTKYYIFSILFFMVSVLCKPSAISFPLCIILLDYLWNEKTTIKQKIINKIPFFLVAVALGIATIYTRTEDKFINQNHAYDFHERIGYAGYAILQYIYKFFIPINLSVIYPYPQNKLLSIIIGYAMLALIIFSCYKLYKNSKKIILFGILFYIANLLLVLQFLPFGEVLTADRYMYLPILGLSWTLLASISLTESRLKISAIVVVILLGSMTFIRTAVWQNSIALYTDIIKKYPHSFVALNSLGAEHMLNKNYELSLRYLNAAINENTEYYKGYYNRGLLFAQTDKMPAAINDFSKAINLKKYNKAYVARANAYYLLKDYANAISDAEMVLKTEPLNVKANYVIANCYDDSNDLNKALNFYNTVVYISNDNPLFLLRRGILYGKMNNYQACLNDLNACTTLDGNFAEAYYWKGVVKANMKQNPCNDFNKALQLGFKAAELPLKNYCR